jgi:hypothetical protein
MRSELRCPDWISTSSGGFGENPFTQRRNVTTFSEETE